MGGLLFSARVLSDHLRLNQQVNLHTHGTEHIFLREKETGIENIIIGTVAFLLNVGVICTYLLIHCERRPVWWKRCYPLLVVSCDLISIDLIGSTWHWRNNHVI